MNQELDHLRLLSIFHYVVGGMAALFACIPFIHFFLGLAMAAGWLENVDPVGQVFGIFFMVFAGMAILTGWTFSICVISAGRFLASRRRYMFCLVMAAVTETRRQRRPVTPEDRIAASVSEGDGVSSDDRGLSVRGTLGRTVAVGVAGQPARRNGAPRESP